MNIFLQNQEVRYESQKRKRVIRVLKMVQQISLIVFAWLLGMAALYGAYVLVVDRDLFTVTRVDVDGDLLHRNKGDIRTLSGVQLGQNLFRIDMNDVQKRLFEDPWVAEVTVRRKLPHTLWIYVSEREPVAIMIGDEKKAKDEGRGTLQTTGGHAKDERASFVRVSEANDRPSSIDITRGDVRTQYIDAKGITFPAGDAALEDLPVMTGFSDATPDDVRHGLALLTHYERHSLFNEFGVSEIHFDPSQGFSIVGSVLPVMIRVGWKDFDSKLNQFMALWPVIRAKGTTPNYVDTNVNGKVIAKYE